MVVAVEELPGMPEAFSLFLVERDGEVFVFRGPHLFFRYDRDDLGMRNLAIVALSDAGIAVNEVAECFGFSRQYVSMLRGRARDAGSGGLIRPRGRSKSLTPARWRKALALSDAGISDREIGVRLGVHHGTVGRRLAVLRAQRGTVGELPLRGGDAGEETGTKRGDHATDDETPGNEAVASDAGGGPRDPVGVPADDDGDVSCRSLVRQGTGEVPSRYAGTMLLHPFLGGLGVDDVLEGIGEYTARRYDAASIVCASTFGFALGIDSLEGAKHLRVADAGALLGLRSFPHLRTLRPRLRALAEASDPLAIQRSFARAMLNADEHPPELFYVDDHFVTYWGDRPVAKGYNIRRHLAEPGRDDTFVVDDRWRAICFSSGEPRGLSVSMGEVIDQLKAVAGDRPVMVGFDRGGSYPKVFGEIHQAGMDWITWRRAPLVAPKVAPQRSWVEVNGKRRSLSVADELVSLKGYEEGPVRQLSAYENNKVCFQVLTSDTRLRPAPLVYKLKGRWCIENFNKYIEHHQGAHWLSTYEMEVEADTALVTNPERKARRQARNAAKSAVSEAERSLGQAMDARYPDTDERITTISEHRDSVTIAKDTLVEAEASLKGIRAKMAKNELDPNAKRAKPRLATRALQMVCRLLAYNAELDLARQLNAYLDDPDEYRSITRHLLHLGGIISFGPRSIAVTLERPDSPRVARALSQLADELNARPAIHLLGDRRPISYKIAES